MVLDGSLFQVFQEYYETVLLKGTSPSAMYVISESCFFLFLFFGHPILPVSSAWIGSTQVRVLIVCSSAEAKLIGSHGQYALVFFPSLISGRLFDIGYVRLPLLIASVNLVLCTLLVAECHEYWHFLLCQGFGVGVKAVAFSRAVTSCL